MNRALTISVMVLIITSLGGCIWIDDSPDHYNAEETIVYINRTDYLVDNYINGEYVGSVNPFSTFYVYSRYLDGRNEYYSVCRDGTLFWGPTYFTLYDGEVFKIYLEESGMYSQSER
ncbi:MAG: hypothetical protein WBM02_10990 [bacterium]